MVTFKPGSKARITRGRLQDSRGFVMKQESDGDVWLAIPINVHGTYAHVCVVADDVVSEMNNDD